MGLSAKTVNIDIVIQLHSFNDSPFGWDSQLSYFNHHTSYNYLYGLFCLKFYISLNEDFPIFLGKNNKKLGHKQNPRTFILYYLINLY